MENRVTPIHWKDVVSWNSVGWYVAVLVGVWGALMGTSDYGVANYFFLLAALSALSKWAHATHLFKETRKTILFTVGLLVCIAGTAVELRWTHNKTIQVQRQDKQLKQLDLLPGLQADVKKLPDLQAKVDKIPEMQQTIVDLRMDNKTAYDAAQKKQEIIEGLAQTVISQQKSIAENAHKDLTQTAAALSTNINQYRTDTTSAVGRIMRPPRTLGDMRAKLVEALKSLGPHDIAITPARGSREAIDFSEELIAAFRDAQWNVVRTQKLAILVKDGTGLRLVTRLTNGDLTDADLTPSQKEVALVFKSIGMQLEANPITGGDTGVVELYVGLQ